MRILVANRGEIARRVIRTASRLGHETVAVFAEPDREAPFVREATTAVPIGPAALAESYLSIERLLDAASATSAAAIHPGYGFLSENADFARAVQSAGLVWIGPHPAAIERMGSKIEARGLADAAGVPTIPGFDGSQDPTELAAAAERIGYPVLVKAAAGGGGKGIRIVREPAEFAASLEQASREAQRSFGNADMIVERYIERARHVEVQIVGDQHGSVIDLGTRECSVQRRYQKLLEEAPAPNLVDATRAGLRESARKLAASMGYDSTGTVEFVVDDATQEYFFLEMNTRLQVEHPVTEAVTGLDLVELQLACAEGRPLPIAQQDVGFRGHAFEARINAEDATAGFMPRTGRVLHLDVPPGVRWDSGIEAGSEITPHYDPMVAKLIVHGPDREAARRRLAAALDALLIGGLVTNAGFHRWLLDQTPVVEGRVATSYLDHCELPGPPDLAPVLALAARAWARSRPAQGSGGPWGALDGFRVTPHRPDRTVALEDRKGELHDVEPANASVAAVPTFVDRDARCVLLNVAGQTHTFRAPTRSERWAAEGSGAALDADQATVAPFPAVVTETPVAAGDTVAAGDVVIVIEAMKMLHSLAAQGAGVIAAVHVEVGESVDSNQVLVSYASGEDAEGE